MERNREGQVHGRLSRKPMESLLAARVGVGGGGEGGGRGGEYPRQLL